MLQEAAKEISFEEVHDLNSPFYNPEKNLLVSGNITYISRL